MASLSCCSYSSVILASLYLCWCVSAFLARPSFSPSTQSLSLVENGHVTWILASRWSSTPAQSLTGAKDRVLRNLSRGLNRAREDSWNSIQSWNSKARSKKFSIVWGAHHDWVWAVSFPHTYFHFHYSDMLVCAESRGHACTTAKFLVATAHLPNLNIDSFCQNENF